MRQRILDSLKAAERVLVGSDRFSSGDDPASVEYLVIEDSESRGAAWARNEGLDRATGDYIFFCDDDDEVTERFFVEPLERIVDAGADFCLFQYDSAPLKREYDLLGDEVAKTLLPAFFGYSFEDVVRWNRGGRLDARREPGSVCRAVFDRGFLERNRLRFRERLLLYEDAMFLSECALAAKRVVSLGKSLYRYLPNPEGTTATVTGSSRHCDYKFAALEIRKELASRYPSVLPYCEASVVFSALELMKLKGDWRSYAGDTFVRDAVYRFPISFRHPLVALSVLWLRIF